jgi:hypothetical protein
MTYDEARALMLQGSPVKRVSTGKVYRPGDEWTFTEQDLSATDFIQMALIEESAKDIQINPPTPTKEGKTMPKINVKAKSPTTVKGLYAGKDAELLLVTSVTSSNAAAAVPVIGKDGKSVDVIGLQVAEKVTLTGKAFVRNAEGEVYEVENVSNEFDVVDKDADMVQATNPDGTPKFELNEDGTPKLDELGQPIPVMIPATAALDIKVA